MSRVLTICIENILTRIKKIHNINSEYIKDVCLNVNNISNMYNLIIYDNNDNKIIDITYNFTDKLDEYYKFKLDYDTIIRFLYDKEYACNLCINWNI